VATAAIIQNPLKMTCLVKKYHCTDVRTVTKLQTELTTQHGTITLITTHAADTVRAVRCFTAVARTKLHHRSQLGGLALSQLINLTTRYSSMTVWHADTYTFSTTLKGSIIYSKNKEKDPTTRMWANAQRDGRPAEYRWRPLFNAAMFGWCPLLECRAVTLPRRETRWYYLGCPKLPDQSQPLVGRSSPYCGDIWMRYCCITSFFFDCQYVPYLRRYSPIKSCDGAQTVIFASFLGSVFPVSRLQQISHLVSQLVSWSLTSLLQHKYGYIRDEDFTPAF